MIKTTRMHRINRSKMVFMTVLLISGITTYVSAQTIVPDPVGEVDEKIHVALYYQWNKANIDSTYLTNREAIHRIDSLLSLKSAFCIDSLHIVAYASPEGNPLYNQQLSEKRGHSFKRFLLEKYPQLIDPQKITIIAKGENWDGLRQMVLKDQNLLLRDKVLAIIDHSGISDQQRQSQIEQLDAGRLYKRYILPKYYRYLRSGASLFVVYNPQIPPDIEYSLPSDSLDLPLFDPEVDLPRPTYRYIRPIAFKTNLLFDLATLFNVEVEIPLGKRFSVLGEWTFPFWGGLGNAGGVAPVPAYSEKFTLQMLSGGLEVRYWFPRSERLDSKATRFGDYNPLTGWFVGLYGSKGVYDFQFSKQGMQSEFYTTSGISAGYAHPVAKYFHLEYSLGVGYVATRYHNYTVTDGHKVVDVRPNGQYDLRKQLFIGPTKLKVSLIWIPRFKVKKSSLDGMSKKEQL